MKIKNLFFGGIIALFFINMFLYITDPGSLFTDIAYPCFALFAIIAGFWAVNQYGSKSAQGKTLILITLGVLFWFLGDITWLIMETVFDIYPYPSIADVFFLLGYPLILLGVLNEVKAKKVKWDFNKKLIVGSIFIVFLAVLIYFGGFLAYDAEATLLENFVGMAYNLGDVIFIFVCLTVLTMTLGFKGGKLFLSWFLFFIAMVLNLAADILFLLFSTSYEEGVSLAIQIDHLWILSYIMLVYFFVGIGDTVQYFKNKIPLK